MRRTWPGPTTTLWMARAVDYDAIVLDLMLPGRDGWRSAGYCARAVSGHQRPHADSSRRGRGSRGRPRRGRRRLPAEAVLLRRAPRPPARARSPGCGRAAGRARGRRPPARPATRQAWRGETEIQVSGKEFALLETFCAAPARSSTSAAPRARMGHRIREPLQRGRRRPRYLRDKVDRPFGRTTLETVRGVGYRLRDEDGS